MPGGIARLRRRSHRVRDLLGVARGGRSAETLPGAHGSRLDRTSDRHLDLCVRIVRFVLRRVHGGVLRAERRQWHLRRVHRIDLLGRCDRVRVAVRGLYRVSSSRSSCPIADYGVPNLSGTAECDEP